MKKVIYSAISLAVIAVLLFGFKPVTDQIVLKLSPEFSKKFDEYQQLKKQHPDPNIKKDAATLKLELKTTKAAVSCIKSIKSEYDYIMLYDDPDYPYALNWSDGEILTDDMRQDIQALSYLHHQYKILMHSNQFFQKGINSVFDKVAKISVTYDSLKGEYSILALKKPISEYGPSDLYWMTQFDGICADSVKMSQREKEIIVEKLRETNFEPFMSMINEF